MFIVIGNRIDREKSVYKAYAFNLEQLSVRLKDCFERKDAQIVTVRRFTLPGTVPKQSEIES